MNRNIGSNDSQALSKSIPGSWVHGVLRGGGRRAGAKVEIEQGSGHLISLPTYLLT